MSYRAKNLGFTLLETLVAIAILMLVISSAFGLLPEGLTGARFAKNQTTASYLAVEALEVVTNLRDNAMIHEESDGDPYYWQKYIAACVDPDTNLSRPPREVCTVNTFENDLIRCRGVCPPVRMIDDPDEGIIYGNGYIFDTNPDAKDTIFTRTVVIRRVLNNLAPNDLGPPGRDDIELLVTATVSWQDGSVLKETIVQKTLFDWYTWTK